jgi:4-alpha-glucanotransferase
MNYMRASGILLHPTSLPGDFGIGDFGPAAFKWVDFLAETGQTYWQILPLGPTGYGDSPYQSLSAFAGNTLLISPEILVKEQLLEPQMLKQLPAMPSDRVDFAAVYELKRKILSHAFNNFQRAGESQLQVLFETFCRENAWWLEDYALFRALKDENGGRPWFEWEEPLRLRDETAILSARERLASVVLAEKFYQFLFFSQWKVLKSYAADKNILLIGDVPIFVSTDSADVWCNRDKFKLLPDGRPRVVAGVPPDYFSKTGQRWGNPIYDWDAMSADGFSWWIARMEFALRLADIVRIDHFRGFVATWEVPANEMTAENGKWVEVPGRELFLALQRALGHLPVIAEDLGVITPEVEELRDSFGFPGMRILQYGFGGDARNRDLPHNYIRNTVAYTGTHDNETAVGWWKSRQSDEKAFCAKYLNTDGKQINWDFIRAVWSSVADTAIAPLQDVFGLGNEARMNLPASVSGNWVWRFSRDKIQKQIIERLAEMTEIYGRKRV